MQNVYRHGDVNLIRVKAIPDGKIIQHKGKHVLAEGEATNSVHELTCDDMQLTDVNGTLYLKLDITATLTHTHDHDTLKIEPGMYVQVPERELDHFADSIQRQVVD